MKKTHERIEQGIFFAVRILLTVLVCLVLFLLLLDSVIGFSYTWKVTFPWENFVLFLLSLAVLLTVLFVWKERELPFARAVWITAGVSLLVQILLMVHLYAYARGDAGVVSEFARRIVYGENADDYVAYFSSCPNNLFLTVLEVGILWVCKVLSIGNWRLVLILLGCLLTSCSGVLLAFTAKNVTKNAQVSLLFYGIFVAFIVFSPRNTVPYSDVYGMIFPLLTLFLWTDGTRKTRYPFAALAGLSAAIGAAIKPTVAIVLIAIFLVDGVRLFTSDGKKERAISLGLLLAGALCGLFLTVLLTGLLPFAFDKEAELGLWHYFMMGQNAETNGTYSAEDNAFSRAFATLADRARANRTEAFSRIGEMGFFGYLGHLCKKLLVTFGDGAFCWRYECEFVTGIPETNGLGRLLRAFFRAEGGAYDVYEVLCQLLWIFLLLCLAGNLFNGDSDPIILLTLVGVGGYQLLFEAGARYLFLFTPFFVLAAATGFCGWKKRLAPLVLIGLRRVCRERS